MTTGPNQPTVRWDSGTGYDLFASLFALYHTAQFGIRPAWAAGVRSRMPARARELFAKVMPFIGVPVRWILDQEPPKDARAVLARLRGIPPDRVLPDLALNPHVPAESDGLLRSVAERGSWSTADREAVAECCRARTDERPRDELVSEWLDLWTDLEQAGAGFAEGVEIYYESFFREEERRIAPALTAAVERGRRLSQSMTVAELVEELTQGLEIESFLSGEGIALIPSFWTSPLILYGAYRRGVTMIVYGARPEDASLDPGDVVPDSLSRALSALADHTRLRIVKLLNRAPRTQAEIARALRLRAPTITHHLRTLRLAGLVRLSISDGREKRYSTRMSRIQETMQAMTDFVQDE